ncbi:MAG: hypothetical protein ABII88_06170 [Candidatus Omnitrophota bacterium]
MNKKAFTIAELIVVLSIMIIILGMTGAYIFNYRSGSALNLCAKEIASALGQARDLSITTQEQHSVIVDIAAETYQIRDSANGLVDSFKAEDGIDIVSVTGYASDTITFNTTGSVGDGSGNIQLRNNQGKICTINIYNVTGQIKIQ